MTQNEMLYMAVASEDLPARIMLDWSIASPAGIGGRAAIDYFREVARTQPFQEAFRLSCWEHGSVASLIPIPPSVIRVRPAANPKAPHAEWPLLVSTHDVDIAIEIPISKIQIPGLDY